MATPFGISFVPGQESGGEGRMGAGGGGVSPLQAAVQFLSLRLPRVTGAQGIAPNALMQSPGGGGFPSPILQALLRLAGLGEGAGSMAPTMPGAGMAMPRMGMPGMGQPGMGPATPRIIPGEQDRMRGPGVPTFPGVPAGSPVVDRRNPAPGNRGTSAPTLSAGPVAKRPFTFGRQGFQRQY